MSPLIKRTIMSQYANSPILMRMIEVITDSIDPSVNIQNFYDIVFNVHTAKGFGLDIWGRIVDIPRELNIPDPDGTYFGFGDGFQPFNQAPFYAGDRDSYTLPDETYRSLILVKAMANVLCATAPNINRLLRAVFDGKRCYFLIIGHMKARFVFEFSLSPFERFLVHESGILPKPCGVEVGVVDAAPLETFGFHGSDFQPFNQGAFYGK